MAVIKSGWPYMADQPRTVTSGTLDTSGVSSFHRQRPLPVCSTRSDQCENQPCIISIWYKCFYYPMAHSLSGMSGVLARTKAISRFYLLATAFPVPWRRLLPDSSMQSGNNNAGSATITPPSHHGGSRSRHTFGRIAGSIQCRNPNFSVHPAANGLQG